MRSKLYTFLSYLVFFAMSAPTLAGVTFNQNLADIVLAPSCNHVPISIPYIPAGAPFDESLITVSSDSGWAIPSVNTALDRIEITFATEDLIASYTATISVDDGEAVTELFIHANVRPLDIYRLLDDPLRSKTYGIQRDGIYNGSIIAFDPIQESILSCITVGESPTDFVINDDSTELFVINSVGKSIDVIDLETFSHKETINLPVYSAWGSAGDTTANIDLGPDDIIYYVDGTWGPVLHTFKRSTGEVLQSTTFNGSMGFMDFAVTSDKTRMVAMPQYGWSAGSHSSIIGHFTINGNGTVNFVKQTSLSSFSREPFEAPVLMRNDDQIAVMKTISTDPANTDNLDRVFPSAIWSMNPNGSVVATGDKLYEYDTGIELYTIPGGSISGSGYTYSKAQTFTSDFTRFVYFNSSDRTLNVVNLIDEIGLELLGQSLNPENGAVVNSPEALTWGPLTGVDQYDLYLSTDEFSIAAADINSPFYLGRVTGTSFALLQTLTEGSVYFWRVDPVTLQGPEAGAVYTFRVSDIALDVNKIDAKTVAGHPDYQVDIQLTTETSGVSWTASAADTWVTFTENTGSTPSTLSVHLDSTLLSSGFHNSTITLSSGSGDLEIPVQLQVEALNVTHIRSDRTSATTYAISEDTSSVISQAYLLEIDSSAEKIQRVIPVGSSVTDFTIHYADNLIYVTNWKSGNLLAIDKSSLEHIKSIAFQPAGATGYSEGDVYRVAAGASQRLVVEEEDQWIDISLFNSNTETTLNKAFVREGGGAFGPAGRYYYHGENNSSGASIVKFDTSGDSFTQLANVRPPEITSYYGSRTVVVSEDGSRIFWAGVALNQSLETEWGIGETVYSTSTDGRYAFSQTAIYDVNLRRQVLEMPTSTSVSGYNSTSEKLITQVGDALSFYPLSTPISIPAPVLSIDSLSYNSIDLSWTDKSLEMEFVVQQRLLGSSTWTDIQTTAANVTSWTAGGLQEGWTYEFRVRASSPDYSSPWSNIASDTVLQSNVKPVAENANFSSHFTESLQGTLTATDSQGFSLSFAVYQQPQYGSVVVNAETGDFTYVPSGTYTGNVYFQFYASNYSVASTPATVTIELTNTSPVATAFEFDSFVDNTLATMLEASDADGDELTYELLGSVSTGQISLSASGLFSYTAIETASHIVTIPYRVSDGQAWSDNGEITLRVHGVSVDVYSPIYLTEFSADKYAGIAAHEVDFLVSVLGGTESYEYLWDFGDGSTSTEQNPGHTFMMPGEYTVRLLVTDQNDSANIASGELKILVLSEPSELSVDFTSSADVGSRQAVFNVSIDGDESPYTLEIDYGDGHTEFATVTSNLHKFEHSYAEFGSYIVSVRVTSQSGVGIQRLSIASGALILNEHSSNQGDGSGASTGGSTSLLMLLMLCLMPLYRKTENL